MENTPILKKVKSDFTKLKDDAISLITSPFSWGIDGVNYFLSFLAVLTVCFFIDEFVREFVRTIHTDLLDKIFSFGHWYGKPSLTIFSFIIFYFGGLVLTLVSSEKILGNIRFGEDEFRNIGLKIFEAFIFSGIIVTTIKSIFSRWRPYTEHGSSSFVFFTLGPNDHLSFPSGDVAVAFSFSVIIAGIFENKLWKIFWYLLASITAAGRIYHDQHWLSDVITASMISILVGLQINKQYKYRTNL